MLSRNCSFSCVAVTTCADTHVVGVVQGIFHSPLPLDYIEPNATTAKIELISKRTDNLETMQADGAEVCEIAIAQLALNAPELKCFILQKAVQLGGWFVHTVPLQRVFCRLRASL
jgi:hypothetical protein